MKQTGAQLKHLDFIQREDAGATQWVGVTMLDLGNIPGSSKLWAVACSVLFAWNTDSWAWSNPFLSQL